MPTESLLTALSERVIIADGAMGTMLQAQDPSLDDFQGYEGCNEILNVTRPDVVASVHSAYFDVGVDCVETNTFGANLTNLGEYGIQSRIRELALAGARIAREVADGYSTPDRPRWVLGSVGPGTKLPTLGHATFADLRDAYSEQVGGLIEGGVDAVLVETVQDLLQAKAALIGARRAMSRAGRTVGLIAQVTVETTGTMLLGSEIGAALTALEPLGIDLIGLNCATGPAEMSEHLRHLSRYARVGISAMPNAGLPQLTADGAHYPLTSEELAAAHDHFTRDYGLSLVGGCCGTTPDHLRAVVERVGGRELTPRDPVSEASAASLYQSVPFRQDTSYLSIGERTNANGSKAFREAMLAEDWEKCVEIAREQIRDGAHLLDLCVDYVGRDGVGDMRELAGRLGTASTLPLVLDSTEPAVLEAGLQMLGGRAVVNSVNYEDGDGPDSRFARIVPLVKEYGAAVVALTIDEQGQARTADWKAQVADRLIADLRDNHGIPPQDVLVDCLTFPIATGQDETRRDGIETIEAIRRIKHAHPEVQTTLGLSNISFGLSPAARQVLNSVFLHECIEVGLDSAIVHASKILPISRISDEELQVARDLVFDHREYAEDGSVSYDPLGRFLDLFAGVSARASAESRAEELAALPLDERLRRRIIDGERSGLEADLDQALQTRQALQIINETLLEGMKVVGELFGRGDMQLPFVLNSAEVMKSAVAYLEPHMEKVEGGQAVGKGTIVLATVKGDVHDIGKNLVDIILTNNGYNVVNIGIKQPVSAILDAAAEHDADLIGMSGLLVKSTVIMKENLEEMNDREVATRWPVLLGGAALTRSFVEVDLANIFGGDVRYARDAFEGLRLMDAFMAVKRGEEGAQLPALRSRRVIARRDRAPRDTAMIPERSDVATGNEVPRPPFWGSRVVRGIPLADYAAFVDERALFLGQWGLKPSRGEEPDHKSQVEVEGYPRLRMWLDRVKTEGLLGAAVVYGYFPCWSEGNDLVILDPAGLAEAESLAQAEVESRGEAKAGAGDAGRPLQKGWQPVELRRLSFPRQSRDRHLCLADYFRSREAVLAEGRPDVVVFHIVTMGSRVSSAATELFESNSYREYVELHGLSVQLTEALAEYWHARVRSELGISEADATDRSTLITKQAYQGERYSFGYPACPDLEQQAVIVDLLDAARISVELSEEFQLHPEQSTSALIVHHPEATYFNAR